MGLSGSQIETIARQVYSQFPDLKDTRPAVQNQPGAKTVGERADQFVLTFKSRGQGPGGQSISRIVRVVADERGKVIKVSTSR